MMMVGVPPFRTEARARRLPRTEIGAALAEVDAYWADSGADPTETFGEPPEYAAPLAHAYRSADPAPVGVRRPRLGALVASGTLAGVMALLAGVEALAGDGRDVITVGQLVSAAAGVAGCAAVPLRPGRGDPRRVDWRFGLVAAVGIAVTAVPQVVWRQEMLRVPGWQLLGVGLVLLAFAWWPLASGRLFANRGVGPVAGAARAGSGGAGIETAGPGRYVSDEPRMGK